MSFAASSPTTSHSPEDSSASPHMDTDLGLDPSDPLNLWLHNTSQGNDTSMDDSSPGGSPPDWSQLSGLWPPSMDAGGNAKMDFNVSLEGDMDFVNSMAIDPNALHLNYTDFPIHDVTYPFSFQTNDTLTPKDALTPSHRHRKLSTTSSSSSSGASFSPVSSPEAPHAVTYVQETFSDPAAELAQRVLQSAGLILAVPADMKTALNGLSINKTSASAPVSASPSQLNVGPIQAHSPQSYSSSASSTSSAPSTPPPSTPPQTNIPLDGSLSTIKPMQQASMGVLSRPKTSHTTIERRYRTNLNARITSLRMAVPALRVLEDKDGCNVGGGGKKGKNSTLGKVVFGSQVKKENEDGTDVIDYIDERGFVDGVKVARKCSKANILGKAVEYIRVLKKREIRLNREQDGLKQLIRGLVGGPALLQEWEREWKAKFGGEEKDEVEGEDEDGSDDEGSGDDDEEEDGRKRKKPKLSPPPKKEAKEKKPAAPQPQPQVLPDGTVIMPEKRKRGRPRKVQPNAPAPGGQTLTFPTMAQQPPVSQQSQPQHSPHSQYLLAVFALFSFFNSPFSSSSFHTSPNHSHTGSVLTHNNAPTHAVVRGWTLHDVIQVFHLLVSVLVFFSIVLPWFPASKYFSLSYLSSIRASYRERARTRSESRTAESRFAHIRAALTKRGSSDEAAALHDALGNDFFSLRSLFGKQKNYTYQQKGLEQCAWVRLGEICVLKGDTSFLNRALTFWLMRAHLCWFTCSAADLSTLALVLYPVCTLARRPARAIWETARARKGYTGDQGRGVGVLIRPHERLVLESMGVDEAYKTLKALPPDSINPRYSPIGILASLVIKERVKKHLQKTFVRTISHPENNLELEEDDVDVAKVTREVEEEEKEMRISIDAARSMGGEVAEIGEMLESLWKVDAHELDWNLEDDVEDNLEGNIRALVIAVLLYRRIFSSSIVGPVGDVHGSAVSILLSPPPSPSRQDARVHLCLRKALGSSVFDSAVGDEFSRALEDARDRVVDMLVDLERACR
ncbi:hypothetical protein E1B28_004954 [Marasmius oreades]|uniref:BHLH domain-containing protein n=1 Tax=Marasmius oreades TaxID=181124 RepID=A0A9P7UZS2_9AGAR|nr:uncharacterized protein E1B28_004954 [Marasmius oreades]KAG7097621.1 hypothetical protein E1B28_004954 [Marasmius oreades]